MNRVMPVKARNTGPPTVVWKCPGTQDVLWTTALTVYDVFRMPVTPPNTNRMSPQKKYANR
jgi:hypothetical protein